MNCGKRMGRMKETKKFKDNWQKYFGLALGIGAVFLIWYLVCRMEMVSAYVLPSPARVWTSFLKMVKTGELWRDISISFLRVRYTDEAIQPIVTMEEANEGEETPEGTASL